MEEFKAIAEGYEVSTFGNVRSTKYKTPRILKPAADKKGYLYVGLSLNGKLKCFKIHRLVALAFIPNPEGKPQINHINGIKTDNRVENLEWVTGLENMHHAISTGLNQQEKLSSEQVRYVRENPEGLTQYELADLLGVCHQTISNVQLGKTYRGGVVRKSKAKRISAEVKAQIRAEYQRGVYGFGSVALGKKYGVEHSTVLKIIKES